MIESPETCFFKTADSKINKWYNGINSILGLNDKQINWAAPTST